MPAVGPNSLIVITGISGYVGSHVGLAALKAGHRVRGTVRSLERAKPVHAAYVKEGIADVDSRLEFVIVDDLCSQEQYHRTFQGADGVVHIAMDISNLKDGDPVMVNNAVDGTLSVLGAAKDISSVRRIVVTSSSFAVIVPPAYRDKPLTDEDWNEETIRMAEEDITKLSPSHIYAYAKIKSEKAAWDFVKRVKPHFDVVSTLPDTNMGPVLHGKATSTAAIVGSLLQNDNIMASLIAPQWYIDVRDNARLHVLALSTPALGGKRVWAAAGPYGWNKILGIFRKHFPNADVPDDFQGSQGEIDRQIIDNTVATELLGGWITLEQSIVDLGKSLGY